MTGNCVPVVAAVLVGCFLYSVKQALLPFRCAFGGAFPSESALFRRLWALARPHTIKGTVLATTTGYILVCLYGSKSISGSAQVSVYVRILLSSVAANFFIVGVNQLTDVASDRHNRKPLPIADGRMSYEEGEISVLVAAAISVFVGSTVSVQWLVCLGLMLAVGAAYSLPPFRFKRHPVLAAVSIVFCRGLLGSVGGCLVLLDVLDVTLADAKDEGRLFAFAGVLGVFALVIAVLKDVADVEGDRTDAVQSFAVLFGPERVMKTGFYLLAGLYVVVIGLLADSLLQQILHLFALSHLLLHWRRNAARKPDFLHNYLTILWPLFYFQFPAFCLPLALEFAGWETRRLALAALGFWLVSQLPRLAATRNSPEYIHTLIADVHLNTGVDLAELHKTLNLPGLPLHRARRLAQAASATLAETRSFQLLAEAAELQWTGMQVHARLVETSDVREEHVVRTSKKTKLAVLGGDWLLAQAVVRLADVGDAQVVQTMSDGIKAFVVKSDGRQGEHEQEQEHQDPILTHALRALAFLGRRL